MKRGRYQVRAEYILEALLSVPAALPGTFTDRYLTSLQDIVKRIHEKEFQAVVPALNVNDVYYGARALEVVRDAALIARRFKRAQAGPAHLLAALLAQDSSETARQMDAAGMNRPRMIAELRDSSLQSSSIIVSADASPLRAAKDVAPEAAVLITDLTLAAKKGQMSKPYFRESETAEIVSILSRSDKSSVLLVGPSGVGKSRLVEGLCVASANGELGGRLEGKHVMDLNVATLLTPAGRQLEHQLVALLKQLQRRGGAILYIDDFHLLADASNAISSDLTDLLSFVLGKSEFVCIGETQPEELADLSAMRPPLADKFVTLRIDPLSPEATHKVLRRFKEGMERRHGVRIGSGTLSAAVLLADEYLRSRELPQKAIEVLDQACARFQLKMALAETNVDALKATVDPRVAGRVTPHDVKKVVCAMASLTLEELNEKERAKLVGLEGILGQRVFAQPAAVAQAARVIREPQRDPGHPNRPYCSMLLAGPAGVGKTRLARELANTVFGSSDLFIEVDLAEYSERYSISRLIGVQPGQPGYHVDGLLSVHLLNTPYCVLYFDNIEMAHPETLELLATIVSGGLVKDTKGRELDFRHAIVLFATRAGADVLDRAQPEDINQSRLLERLGRSLPAVLLRYIDVLLPFYTLSREDARLIARHLIDGVRHALADHEVGLRMFESAYTYLLDNGFDPERGAAALDAVVERYVADPVAQLCGEGRFVKGDMIEIRLNGGTLAYMKGSQNATGLAG